MKKQFNLQDWLKDKSQKVETRDGRPVRIVCWDRKDAYPIVALATEAHGNESYINCYSDGRKTIHSQEFLSDLFIVTPEPTDMSEFGMKVSEFAEAYELAATDCESEEYKTCNGNLQLIIDKYAAELLAIAKQQLLQSGELLTQERHEKLMETQYNKTLEGVKKNWHDYFTPQAVTDIYNAGRNDVLKGLPRWKKYNTPGMSNGELSLTLYSGVYEVSYLFIDKGLYIPISDLEKLPGFKED